MKKILFLFCCILGCVIGKAQNSADNRSKLFDGGWRFLKDSIITADDPQYDDSKWRTINLPHDWSIEDLPNQTPDTVVGPFDRNSVGQSATGFTVGGTGWYRKKFISEKSFQNHLVTIHFDGVYMNSDVWLNGHHLGNHPYGYTPFYYDLTAYLKPAGQQNVLAVKVRNEGKNSRWYSGSGIYRHVWLTVTEAIHVAHWGVYIKTPEVSANVATVQIKSSLDNEQATLRNISLVTTLVSPDGKKVGHTQKVLQLGANASTTDSQTITVSNPALWSVETPRLYKAITEIKSGNKTIDHVETSFGIRSISFDAANGFLLNNRRVILKGGCIHHDNGPLGRLLLTEQKNAK